MPQIRKPPFRLSPEDIKKLETLGGLGHTLEECALIFSVSKETLERAIKKSNTAREALLRGRAIANSVVARTAYQMATSGQHPGMSMYWLKVRAGWKDTIHLAPELPPGTEIASSREIKEIDSEQLTQLMLKLRDKPDDEECTLTQNLPISSSR